jgi:hypothetical protein
MKSLVIAGILAGACAARPQPRPSAPPVRAAVRAAPQPPTLAVVPAPPAPAAAVAVPAAPPSPAFTPFRRGRVPDPGRVCTATDFATIPQRDDARAWADVVATCRLSFKAGADHLRAYRDFARALLAASYPNECVKLLAPITTPYAGGLRVEAGDPRAKLAGEIKALAKRCELAHEQLRAVFVRPTCPGPTCFTIVADPRNPPRGPDEGSFGQCLTIAHRGKPLLATAGPLRDEGFCCTIEKVTLLDRDDRFLRITGGGRVCGGGTGSESVDAVYRIAGTRLVLEVDDSIVWH